MNIEKEKHAEEIKKAVLPRPATSRELQLLENVFAGRRRSASRDQRILGNYSQGKLEESLRIPKVTTL